jgi:hypothetical protein
MSDDICLDVRRSISPRKPVVTVRSKISKERIEPHGPAPQRSERNPKISHRGCVEEYSLQI